MNKRLGVAAILSGLLVSCIGVVPLPKRTVSQNGRIANVDLAFVETGHTTREEIAGKLQSTDTGYKSDRFFIGRWRTSGWGEWFAAAAPGAGGGVSADRIWRDTNLLVEFDPSGAVQHYETFPDSLLLLKLAPVVPEQKLPIDEELEVSILLELERSRPI